jgi:hypothetical protein
MFRRCGLETRALIHEKKKNLRIAGSEWSMGMVVDGFEAEAKHIDGSASLFGLNTKGPMLVRQGRRGHGMA